MFINGVKVEGVPPIEQLDTIVKELAKTGQSPKHLSIGKGVPSS